MDPKTSPSDGGLVVFPPELFRLIIQHLSDDRQALCAISLVCKILQEEGQRQLYRKIISPRGAGIHIEFLKCILDNNRLALLIHEYTQEGIAPHQRGTLLWDYLCRGLQAMVNLKVLKFCALDGQSSAEILSGCTFQLRSLVWGNRDDEGHLSKFLLSQHNLRGLDVDWAEDKRDLISRSCCPQLRVLCGDRGALETFLPGREITSLNWIPQPSFLYSSDSIHSFERLLPYLLRIRFLSFAEYYPRQSECIRSIIRFFPSVEVLKLELLEVFSHDVSGRLSSLSSALIFATIWLAGIIREDLNASSPEGIADPCDFEYFGRCTYTGRQAPANHHQHFRELHEVETDSPFSGFGELSNLSMESGVTRHSGYSHPLGRGSSMVARVKGVQWKDCNASCKMILECLHRKVLLIRESPVKRTVYIGRSTEYIGLAFNRSRKDSEMKREKMTRAISGGTGKRYIKMGETR